MKKYWDWETPALIATFIGWALVVFGQIAALGAVIYVAMHFIKKYW